MSAKNDLESNNIDLQNILDIVNELPSAVSVDGTLSISGAAADAKATGDAIAELTDAISNVGDSVVKYLTIGTNWTENEDTGVKSQTFSIAECTGEIDEVAKIDVYFNGDGSPDSYATFVEQQNQFLDFITNGYGETIAGAIVLYIFGDANTVDIHVVAEVR